MIEPITGEALQAMVRHWLNTPTSGYLGSDYGQEAKILLQRPQEDGLADAVLNKLKADVPATGALSDGVNLYSVQSAPDRMDVLIEVAGGLIGFSGD
jgi:hypothetical protein